MTDLRQAAQLALGALLSVKNHGWDEDTHTGRALITALRTALEQQQAEPMAVHQWRKQGCANWYDGYPDYSDGDGPYETRTFYTAPLQQQAEPVAWMDREGDLYKMPEIPEWAPPHTMLYTSPPQRKWVGLTDEDVNRESAMIAQKMKLAFHAGMYVAQQILKEKNT